MIIGSWTEIMLKARSFLNTTKMTRKKKLGDCWLTNIALARAIFRCLPPIFPMRLEKSGEYLIRMLAIILSISLKNAMEPYCPLRKRNIILSCQNGGRKLQSRNMILNRRSDVLPKKSAWLLSDSQTIYS